METNVIITGDNVVQMRNTSAESIDLTVTSPPYDGLRTYNGYSFDFESVAKELYRVTKDGGVVVWVVGDATVKGSETGSSFRQALYFKEIGFNLHDTMIYAKQSVSVHDSRNRRYKQAFEYMFILSKGKPTTYNEIKDKPNKSAGRKAVGSAGRNPDDTKRKIKEFIIGEFQARFNIWEYGTGRSRSTKDRIAFQHPAIFPEKLAEDHILSWSNEGDVVFDPFGGSGTTAKMAKVNGRQYIHIDVSEEYNEIARQRLEAID